MCCVNGKGACEHSGVVVMFGKERGLVLIWDSVVSMGAFATHNSDDAQFIFNWSVENFNVLEATREHFYLPFGLFWRCVTNFIFNSVDDYKNWLSSLTWRN